MPFDEPRWWYSTGADQRTRALAPAGRFYGWLSETRYRRRQSYRSRLPVICAGNLTAGGTGKTPLARLIAELLIGHGENPALLTRGYGGRDPGQRGLWVDPAIHTACDTGDEALLLVRSAACLVSPDRREGARIIERDARNFSAIIMDDGLQNGALRKDLSFAVVDGLRGLGNGEVIPAGPLRAPLDFQLGLVDAIIVNGPPGAIQPGVEPAVRSTLRRQFPGPVLAAEALPAGDASWIVGTPVVAYAGIANPSRFFDALKTAGAELVERAAFPDHHPFNEADARRLLGLARSRKARLVTTEKDEARLAGTRGVLKELREASTTFPIRLAFADKDLERLQSLIGAALKSGGYRFGPYQR